jgi:hypothetical protein
MRGRGEPPNKGLKRTRHGQDGGAGRSMSGADPNEWEQMWETRKRALETLLGPTTDRVFHAAIPLDLGGSADVLEFPRSRGGGHIRHRRLGGSVLGTAREQTWAV